MTDRSVFDLDSALAEIAGKLRAAAPGVSDRLRARVLGDAADVAASRKAAAQRAAGARPAARPRVLRTRILGFLDVWAGVAAAAIVLFLIAGLGVGYQAGDQIMAEAGFANQVVAVAAHDSGGLFVPEDVL